MDTRSRRRMFLGVKRSRCVGLTTLPPSVSRLSRQCGILNIDQPFRPQQPESSWISHSSNGIANVLAENRIGDQPKTKQGIYSYCQGTGSVRYKIHKSCLNAWGSLRLSPSIQRLCREYFFTESNKPTVIHSHAIHLWQNGLVRISANGFQLKVFMLFTKYSHVFWSTQQSY
jgi:hypothetical protein